MATPTGLLWERDPHTAAKHTLLNRYMMAWFPIMAKQYGERGITFLDGFAGPGEYTNAVESSPLIVMRQAHRHDVTQHQTATRLLFIEDRRDRAQHLESVLEREFPPARRPGHLTVGVVHGRCQQLFEAELARLGAWAGPIFANLDGWGADTHYSMVCRIAQQISSEVLVTFKHEFFVRFANLEDLDTGDKVFGFTDWRNVGELPTAAKLPFLLDLYRQRLKLAGFSNILTFEMRDEGGHALFQFFATRSVVAVKKFKDALWEVDGVSGQRFRDPRDQNQLSFDIAKPDFTALEDALLKLVELSGSVDLETLAQHALLETIYKDTHARPAVERLVDRGKLQQTATGRSHAERTFRLADPRLF